MTILQSLTSQLPPGVLATGGFAAIGAIIVTARNQIKNFVSYVSNAILVQSDVEGSTLSSTVRMHLRGKYKRMPLGMVTYRSLMAQIRGDALWKTVPFEMPPTVSFYLGKRGFFISHVSHSQSIRLTSIRGWSSVKDLINDALDAYEDSQDNTEVGYYSLTKVIGTAGDTGIDLEGMRSRGRTGNGDSNNESPPSEAIDSAGAPDYRVDKSFRYSTEDLNWSRKEDPYRGLFFEKNTEDLIADANRWYSMRKWYEDRNIPWRRGYLLHGPGGTGKSSLTKALAQSLRVHLYQFFLSTMTDKEFVREWEGLNTPCIVLVEDIDGIFNGRENITVHKSLSFDCLLNQISGVGAMNGILLVVTTNKLECIDPALGTAIDETGTGRSTRPGRLDVILRMGETSRETRSRIVDFSLPDASQELKDLLVDTGEGMTPAQFQATCVEVAFAHVNGVTDEQQIAKLKEAVSGHPTEDSGTGKQPLKTLSNDLYEAHANSHFSRDLSPADVSFDYPTF